MTDEEYDFLVASHGDTVPPRDRIRLHDCQLPALDSLLRVMREDGIGREVRVVGIFATASGQTKIDIEYTDAVDPRSLDALCHTINFWRFEKKFEEIVKGNAMTERLPIGWLDLVTDLRLALIKAYPDVTVTEMTADRGWLYVRVDDSGMDPSERHRLDRMVQGFVTQSLHTCGGCGSGHARDRGNGRVVTCDECEEETCNADG